MFIRFEYSVPESTINFTCFPKVSYTSILFRRDEFKMETVSDADTGFGNNLALSTD